MLGARVDPYPRAEAVRERTRGLLRLLAGVDGGETHASQAGPGAKVGHGANAGHGAEAGHGAKVVRMGGPAARDAHSSRAIDHADTADSADTADPVDSAVAAPAARLADCAISILTRSSLALRDLELLVDLDQRHVLTVGVLLPTTDPRLLRRLEPRVTSASFASSAIDDRLHLAATLAAHGIATRILCSPIVAGMNNSAGSLRGLFEAALAAGASDVLPAPLHPNLPPTTAESGQLLALFYRLRLQYGFPRILPGRA
jgi:hypothetical protein